MLRDFRKELTEEYRRKRQQNLEAVQERRLQLYALDPAFRRLDDEIRDGSQEIFRAASEAGLKLSDLDTQIDQYIRRKSTERQVLFRKHGLPENYLQPIFECSLCQDTGSVDGHDCLCFRSELARRAFRSEDLTNGTGPDLSGWNADIMDQIDQKNNALAIHRYALEYVEKFESQEGRSLIFFGEPGLGKTYLTNAIAKSLTERGKFVIYQSAPELFQVDLQDKNRYKDELFRADLLVIDDLGKENLTDYLYSELFNLINHRVLTKKSFIISTNLDLKNILRRYGDAIFNRLTAVCSAHEFFGEELRTKAR